MNDNTLYTRCPTCSTAFKVTDEFLELAGGKARCGACLAVFQATDYMLRPSRISAPAPTQTKTETKQAKAAPSNSGSDNTKLSDVRPNTPAPRKEQTSAVNMAAKAKIDQPTKQPVIDRSNHNSEERLESETQKQPDIEKNPQETLDLDDNPEVEERKIPEPALETRAEPKDQPSTTEIHEQSLDESLAIAELDSFGEDEDMLAKIEDLEIDLIESLDNLEDENESPEIDEPSETNESPDLNSENDQRSVEKPILHEEKQDIEIETEELNKDSTETKNSLSTPIPIHKATLAEQDPAIEVSEWDDDDDDVAIEDVEIEDLDEDFGEEDIEENLEELSVQLFEQMEDTDTDPDPLDEFDDIVKNDKKGIKSKLIFASVGILLFIAIWQFWSNRQSLAWSNNWAGATKAVCNYLPCNLKPRRDVSKIKLLQRQLSPDEDRENYLDIKVLLMNEASFDQPYPTIKIIFSDKDGQQVSVKSFTPRDYLDTDASSATMPSGSEVHIRFKTEVTHPNALGFEFKFE